jgi:hypothetical protein
MLFLVLMATLAVGFFVSVRMSVQVAKNERDATRARLAAESGLQFVRYQLATLDIPPGTSDADMAAEIAADLAATLNATANLGPRTVGRQGNVVTVPEIAVDEDGAFSTHLEWVPVAAPGTSYLRATVTGTTGAGEARVSRAVRLDYGVRPKQTSLFNYGIASRGAISIKNSAQTNVLGQPGTSASILSAAGGATSITTGGGTVSGDLSVVVAKTQVSLGGGSVGGTSNTQLIREEHIDVVPAPAFPMVDTAPFKQFATNLYKAKTAYQKNVRVPPNTNPKFNAGDVIDGILYVESPNAVDFRGHAQVNGIVVFEGKGTSAVNALDFRGNVSPSKIPDTAEFAALRAAARGWAILAPTASVVMSGSTDGDLEGSIMSERVTLAGSADLKITRGSIITLGTAVTDISGKTITFVGSAAENAPTSGLTFSGRFLPDPTSYSEP